MMLESTSRHFKIVLTFVCMMFLKCYAAAAQRCPACGGPGFKPPGNLCTDSFHADYALGEPVRINVHHDPINQEDWRKAHITNYTYLPEGQQHYDVVLSGNMPCPKCNTAQAAQLPKQPQPRNVLPDIMSLEVLKRHREDYVTELDKLRHPCPKCKRIRYEPYGDCTEFWFHDLANGRYDVLDNAVKDIDVKIALIGRTCWTCYGTFWVPNCVPGTQRREMKSYPYGMLMRKLDAIPDKHRRLADVRYSPHCGSCGNLKSRPQPAGCLQPHH